MTCLLREDTKHDMQVDLIKYENELYVLKTFDKAKVMESDTRIEEIMNERELLKETYFTNLNKLVQTTKEDGKLCLVL